MNDLASTPPEPTARLSGDQEGIAEAAGLLRSGQLVAFPTETVYGLGADATDPAAVTRIFAAKERPRFNPLIAHLPDLAAARRQGRFDAFAEALASAFWPGPLTLVVPATEATEVCDLARAGLPSVALRVPGHPVARDLLQAFGRPLAGPSANRSGRVSPTCAEHVLADLDGRIAAVLDGGSTRVGIESTVVACLGGTPRLLRPGGITRAALAAVLGQEPETAGDADAARPAGPGLLASHYAPRARVRLDATALEPGEAALLFGGARPEGLAEAAAVLDLSPDGDLGEAAARLFGALRDLDASKAPCIAVSPIPKTGLGEAIRDRLNRAAAPR
ncbi:L-threonylcarbamoyladenylate synthase [Methylobacterium radiodurans]|uniref:Threonylcarbamoyl-AMP synthase n=1 Tax=Methylobacterium radiodurans TaxID=2202828 RepID=A0A2U8VQU0_9HYPH|nr:L-threonylcarbamoyladenylate synthase [Methylobacterium radiodurans]AWN36129.1 threonylcarbamoyl-AMP synthase [Methylobacterium radiodurans]